MNALSSGRTHQSVGTRYDAGIFLENQRHLLRTIFTQPIELKPAQGTVRRIAIAHGAAPVKPR